MTPSQADQKARAQAEAEHHLQHSAVDRMREAVMAQRDVKQAQLGREQAGLTRRYRDANNAFAGEE